MNFCFSAARFRSRAPHCFLICAALAVATLGALAPSARASSPTAPTACTTSSQTVSNSTPMSIPDGTTLGDYSAINVTSANTYIWDVDVTTNVTHTNSGDLQMSLSSPGGTDIWLAYGRGGANDNVFNGTVWDDQATNTVSDQAFTNLVVATPLVPEDKLSNLIGENPNGEWDLNIVDPYTGGTGSLNSWSITITTCNAPPPSGGLNAASSTPVTIPASGSVTSTATVSGAAGGSRVCDVNVTTGLRHQSSGDMTLTLTSPTGTVTTLTSGNGAGFRNVFDGTLWDDQALSPVALWNFSMSGNDNTLSALSPEGALSKFNGETLINGTWTLTLNDTIANGTGGTLNGWGLRVMTCQAPTVPAAVPVPVVSTAATISGSATTGGSLTAVEGNWMTLDDSLATTLQWRHCDSAGNSCTNIAGATSPSYALTAADIGFTIRLVESATNVGGAATPTTTAQTAVVAAPPPPANTVVPTVSGTARNGSQLLSTDGTWTGPNVSFTYQWQRCDAAGANCANIAGATSWYRYLAAADIGSTVRLVVTGTNSSGSASANSAATAVVQQMLAPSNTTLPSATGTAQHGNSLYGTDGSWNDTSGATYAYQWRRCDTAGATCSDIAGATAYRYTLQAADVGSTVRIVVTVTNVAGSAAATSAQTATVIAATMPANTAIPVLSGTAKHGNALYGTDGTWTGNNLVYTYQWRRCNSAGAACVDIAGTNSSHTIVPADVAATLRLVVTATNPAGAVSATSSQTAVILAASAPTNSTAPTISGSSTTQGRTLTGRTGSWSGADIVYAYQWLRCDTAGASCAAIAEGTSSTWVNSPADGGHTLRFQVTATNTGGSLTKMTAPTGVIATPRTFNTTPAPDVIAPTVSAAPAAALKQVAVLKSGLSSKVTVSEQSTVTQELRLPPKVAKQLKLPEIVGTVTASGSGTFTMTVKISPKAKAKLAKLAKVTLTLKTTARDSAGNVSSANSKTVTLKKH